MTDEIDQDTMYFDGQPPEWTYEKLRELYDNGELEGNIDVSSKGEVLNKLEAYNSSGLEQIDFVRCIPITGDIVYKIVKSYWHGGMVFESRYIAGDFDRYRGHIFVPFKGSYDEAKELVKKLLESEFYREIAGESDGR